MPTELAAALVAEGLFATTASATSFLSAVGTVALAVGSYAVQASLAPSKAGNSARAADQQTVSSVEASAPWEIAYGRVRKGGRIVFQHVSSATGSNVERHLVPSSPPYTVRVDRADVFDSDVDAGKIINTPDDGDMYEPVSYTVVDGLYTFDAGLAGESVRIIYNAFNGSTTLFHRVIVLAAHRSEAIEEIYLNDLLVQFNPDGSAIGTYAGYLKVFKHLGVPGEPANAELMRWLPKLWTPAHTLEGHTYIVCQFSKTSQVSPWAQGIPNVSVVGRWKQDIFDPRTNARGYTDNAVLCLADYLSMPALGLSAPYGEKIDNDRLIAEANICDELMPLAAGGSEKRYTCNGVISLAEKPIGILQALLSSCAGRCVYVDRKWRLHAGAYTAPAVTISEGDMRGPLSITSRLSRREAFNAVKGTFLSPESLWQPVDFPEVASDQYMAEDGGERIYKNVELRFTTSAATAQRLAKIDLLRARQQMSAQLPLKLRGYNAQPPDTVALTLPKPGWVDKPFELVELSLDLGSIVPGITYTVRETSPTVFDWNTDEESPLDPAPNTSLQNPFSVEPPGIPDVEEVLYTQLGTMVRIKAIVRWHRGLNSTANSYVLQWQKRGDVAWGEYRDLTFPQAEVLDVESGVEYFFRVSAMSALGVVSDWRQRAITFTGFSGVPADVTGFSISKISGTASGQWDPSVDTDVRLGGSIVIRHTTNTAAPTWEMGIIVGEFAGVSTGGSLPLLQGTYMAKWRDPMEGYSVGTALFAATEGMVTGFSTVGTRVEAPAFTGVKTGVVIDAGVGGLRMVSPPGVGTYLFSSALDLSTVVTRRVESRITALSYTIGLFDDDPGMFDDGGDFDGVSGINETDVTLYARTTNDDPAGSPVWSPWVPFFVADFTCRALEFKCELSSSSGARNIVISELTVTVKVPI